MAQIKNLREGLNRKSLSLKAIVAWMFVFPPYSNFDSLSPNVMVLGGGGLWESI